MDDRNFDKQSAQIWIRAVEKNVKSWRDFYVYSKLNDMIRTTLATSIIDIGCGQGICSEKIDLNACKYTGVEPSPYLLERAKQLYTANNISFISGNAYALPVPDQSFEAAFSILVWHLLMDLQLSSSELSRVLTKNGNFLLITANPNSYTAWKNLYSNAKSDGKKFQGTMQLGEEWSQDVLYLHTFEEIKESLQKEGLSIEHTESFLPAVDSPETKMLILIQGRKFR